MLRRPDIKAYYYESEYQDFSSLKQLKGWNDIN